MEAKWSTEQHCACGNTTKPAAKNYQTFSRDCETSRPNSRNFDIARNVSAAGSNFDSRWQIEKSTFTRTAESNLNKSDQNLEWKNQPKTPKNSNCETKQVGDALNFIAGGAAGAVSTCFTMPLEVLKTRQQSSATLEVLKNDPNTSRQILRTKNSTNLVASMFRNSARNAHSSGIIAPTATLTGSRLQPLTLQYWKYIIHNEGRQALFKGLAPSLIAVIPTRGTYFYMYKKSKDFLKHRGMETNSSLSHILAACSGGFCATTISAPLWMLKTKQQLHRRLNNTSLGLLECGKSVWKTEGWKGFYRGVGASYFLISDTVLYFWMYENIKARYLCKPEVGGGLNCDVKKSSDLFALMMIGSVSKVFSSMVCYPGEVIRTRLREEAKQKKYKGISQTFKKVYRHEGMRGLYGGLTVHLVRQVPNMAIVMLVYESIIHLAS